MRDPEKTEPGTKLKVLKEQSVWNIRGTTIVKLFIIIHYLERYPWDLKTVFVWTGNIRQTNFWFSKHLSKKVSLCRKTQKRPLRLGKRFVKPKTSNNSKQTKISQKSLHRAEKQRWQSLVLFSFAKIRKMPIFGFDPALWFYGDALIHYAKSGIVRWNLQNL